ncbi:hypothetical protein OPV22_019078 [Ensete ventricosum]|uniref:RING-type domain-containing protein n=1 Tax=Ensete ventricosum TaxID=4639 RepID=A0AAV8R024_ENSVE|nr:hypothetical protein OPV22_019078 [Ensete ventricosum]
MSGSGVDGSSFLPPDDNSTGRLPGLAYGLGVSVGILMVITAALLASYLCTRARTTAANRRSGDDAATLADLEAGIDEATLTSYPKVSYSQAKLEEKGTTAACCSICLSDYKDADVLRRLPDCGHLFHLDCVDPWLRSHRSCPNCRSSPAPSSMPTPLSEPEEENETIDFVSPSCNGFLFNGRSIGFFGFFHALNPLGGHIGAKDPIFKGAFDKR